MESLTQRVERAFADAEARADEVSELLGSAGTEFDAIVILLDRHQRALKTALLEIAADIEELSPR
jgi:hypothetical protein